MIFGVISCLFRLLQLERIHLAGWLNSESPLNTPMIEDSPKVGLLAWIGMQSDDCPIRLIEFRIVNLSELGFCEA